MEVNDQFQALAALSLVKMSHLQFFKKLVGPLSQFECSEDQKNLFFQQGIDARTLDSSSSWKDKRKLSSAKEHEN
jgi:hypothetical protein